ncbi:MAG: response regulator [Deltaproteobacteria bacterium]|nr:MAG: response regulator [Deltaproteobacteria bacterium]
MTMVNTDYLSSNHGLQKYSAPEVLIAEKDKLLRLMMAKLLQVSGYRVYTCGDGSQALNLAARKSFDLVITDLMLPGASGMDVLKFVKKLQPRAKVIMVTDTPSSETLLEAKYEGAYSYLRKPLQLRQFLLILKDAIEHTRLQDGYQLRKELEGETRNLEGGI